MKTKKIIESSFVMAFINDYWQDKEYHFLDKGRLLYILCSTDLEKQQVTAKQIEIIKSEIQKLGNEEVSFAYLMSCKPEEKWSYIEPNKRFDVWVNDCVNNFDIDFSEIFIKKIPPVKHTMRTFKETKHWEFDFEEYQKFIDTSEPIAFLFNISELYVQMRRLEMFREFLKETQQTKSDKIKAPVLGLFCNLINRIGIDKKEETESATVYCKRICDKFQLTYTDRVRQNYNVNETKKLIQELTEKVFPLIDNVTKDKIEKYLDSKQPPKQNLYA